MNRKIFTKLDGPEDYPGTVTKIHTGSRLIKVGDIVGIEWMHKQPLIGQDVQGEIIALDGFERHGSMGQEYVCKVTLNTGWYSQALDPYMGVPDSDGTMVMTAGRVTNRAEFERTFEITTSDDPGWHLFILGGSDERLAEIASMMAISVEQLKRDYR